MSNQSPGRRILLAGSAIMLAAGHAASPPMRTTVKDGRVERRPATAAELQLDAAEAHADAAADAADLRDGPSLHCSSGRRGAVVVSAPGQYGRDQRNVRYYCKPIAAAELRMLRLDSLRRARLGLARAREASPAEIARAARELDARIARLERAY